ncbi:cell adhesion molecule CEACAM5-like isoform X2 [Eucyclogobius newberryi]|uniref:cell adhesion molecule CEACAM5-like isoform X2 n=1 Tax=Eucyclogobius newberryi TaxID=166745 RepID=UPI003B5B8E3D
MSCSADSRPAAQFQWLFNGELLSFTGAQLELMKIQMNQSGDYSCQAFNSKTHRYTTSEPGLISVLNGPENVQISGPKEIQEGKTLKLRCFCDSVPTANYTWIKNRKILAQSSEYTKESAGSSDSGQYICKATNKITKKTVEASHTVLVTERVSDARVTVSSSDSVEFISSVTLSCSASGLSLSFLWLNGSDEVTASDRVNLTDGGATLTIATVRRSDQGPFRCKVSNPVSSSTSDPAELSISYGPDDVILKTSPQIDDFEEGSDVLMSCSADSRPAAQFQWLFNGELLSFTGAQLELMKIQMNQSGDYSCQAFNSKTHRYTTSEPGLISVLKRIMNISVESSSNQPMEGSSVNIICDASGSIFSRKWLINGQELKPSENIVFYEQKQVLSFNVLNRKDSGTYVCEISNSINSETASYSLHVNYGPENVQISGPKEIQEGKTLKLRCFCDSVPTANYTWIKNRKILAQSSEYTKESAGSSDSGQYICKATNKITKKTVEASHTVLVTERVSDARVTVSSSDSVEFISSVTLSCSASGLSLSFLWLNGSDEVTASDRVNLTDGGATLTIATVRRSDQGPFRCKVSNPVSSSTSDPAELSISCE